MDIMKMTMNEIKADLDKACAELLEAVDLRLEESRTELRAAYEAKDYDKSRKICARIRALEDERIDLLNPGVIVIGPTFEDEDEEVEYNARRAEESARAKQERIQTFWNTQR